MTPHLPRATVPALAAVRPLILLMGVAGSGKSLIGLRLAEALGSAFVDADSLHSPENIARMGSGQPLGDAERAPWLAACAAVLSEWRREGRCGVLACSALKRAYRRRLDLDAPDVLLVHLVVSRDLAERRLQARENHFMPPRLMASQFADLEIPSPEENALALDAGRPPEEIVASIADRVSARFGLSAPERRASLAPPRPSIKGERP